MNELFNLVNIREMYKTESNFELVKKFDTLISIFMDELLSKNQKPELVTLTE